MKGGTALPVLLILFIAVPLIEIYVLVSVGKVIGALPTVLAVVATAVLGVFLLRRQGRQALVNARAKLQAGSVPSMELAEGVFLAAGGMLLLTPGFMTDALGFLCLVPGIRQRLIKRWSARLFMGAQGPFRPGANPAGHDRDSHTIEGEYRRDDDEPRNLP